MKRGLALACTLGLLALGAPAASASPGYDASFMDDQLLLARSEARVRSSLTEMRDLGGDRLRVSAFWGHIAPATGEASRPAGFDGADHADPAYRWDDLDRVVRIAGEVGLPVTISITGPGPLWASANPARGRLWRPNPTEFGRFAEAVARRYRDQVSRYAIWNEPNQAGWLQPQSLCRGRGSRRRCLLTSPIIYRNLVNASQPRIRAADPGARILVGELAPSGRETRDARRPIRPLLFLKRMMCRSRSYKRMRGLGCRNYRPLLVDGIGHHPYNLLQAPRVRSTNIEDAALADTGRLLRVLDRLHARGALRSSTGRRLLVYYTEFGYQTRPPDPHVGVSLFAQRRWLQEAAWMVWRQPRVRELNQFRLVDGPLGDGAGRERFQEFQSGLRFAGGSAKPSLRVFPNPFHATPRTLRRGRTTLLWGQVRTGNPGTVEIQRRVGSGPWHRLTVRSTDRHGGFVHRTRPGRTARYRFVATDPGGRNVVSDSYVVRVRRR